MATFMTAVNQMYYTAAAGGDADGTGDVGVRMRGTVPTNFQIIIVAVSCPPMSPSAATN